MKLSKEVRERNKSFSKTDEGVFWKTFKKTGDPQLMRHALSCVYPELLNEDNQDNGLEL